MSRRISWCLAVVAWCAFVEGEARAADSWALQWLPGDAREISHASSASRDTAALEAIVLPRYAVTLGTEFGIAALHTRGPTLRLGALALFGLESQVKSTRLFPAPGGDSNLWRGVLGYEMACSFDRIPGQALGEHGAIELSLGYYHESDHHTASNTPIGPGVLPDHRDLRGRPQVGNYLAADLAVRFQLSSFEVVLREESKLFTNGTNQATPFRAGAGAELVLQLHQPVRGATPFWSTYVESLIARDRAPTGRLRSILGVSLPGVRGDLRLYASFDSGAGRGLLIPEHETAFGAGFRYTPFAPDWR